MTTGKTEEIDYTDGGRLPTIEEMSGSIHFGGRVVFEDGEPVVLTPEETVAHERARLERAVLDAAIEEYKMEYVADHGSNTITRTEALIKMQRAMKTKRAAVDALLAFEAKQKNGPQD